jgi:hypothetical protein
MPLATAIFAFLRFTLCDASQFWSVGAHMTRRGIYLVAQMELLSALWWHDHLSSGNTNVRKPEHEKAKWFYPD